MKTLGKITSTPDANGNHKLECPKCHTSFLAPVTKDTSTGQLHNVTCATCRYSDAPLVFLHAGNEEKTNQMAKNYVEREMKKALKKAFRGSKNIRFK